MLHVQVYLDVHKNRSLKPTVFSTGLVQQLVIKATTFLLCIHFIQQEGSKFARSMDLKTQSKRHFVKQFVNNCLQQFLKIKYRQKQKKYSLSSQLKFFKLAFTILMAVYLTDSRCCIWKKPALQFFYGTLLTIEVQIHKTSKANLQLTCKCTQLALKRIFIRVQNNWQSVKWQQSKW